MKKFYLFLLFSFMYFHQINAQISTPQPADITKFLSFKNDNYDMGKISNGKPIEFTVDVLNISNSNITLDNVIVGCGCTTPKYIKGQVLTPGSHAIVTLGFNGAAIGPFSKSATLFFSGNLVKTISFHGVGVE
jgi:hypothetical protein